MKYNYEKLKGRIAEKCGSVRQFSKRTDLTERSIYNKLTNQIPFTQCDIEDFIGILEIPRKEIPQYFFTIN